MAHAAEALEKRVTLKTLYRFGGPDALQTDFVVGFACLTRRFANMFNAVPDEFLLALALFLQREPGDAATVPTKSLGTFVFLAMFAGIAIEVAFRADTSVFKLGKVTHLVLLTFDRFHCPHAFIGLPFAARPTLTLTFVLNPFQPEFFQTLVEDQTIWLGVDGPRQNE